MENFKLQDNRKLLFRGYEIVDLLDYFTDKELEEILDYIRYWEIPEGKELLPVFKYFAYKFNTDCYTWINVGYTPIEIYQKDDKWYCKTYCYLYINPCTKIFQSKIFDIELNTSRINLPTDIHLFPSKIDEMNKSQEEKIWNLLSLRDDTSEINMLLDEN